MPERGSPSANLVAERCNREGPGWPGRQLRVTGGVPRGQNRIPAHRLGYFLHEQGNAVGALDDILPDACWQAFLSAAWRNVAGWAERCVFGRSVRLAHRGSGEDIPKKPRRSPAVTMSGGLDDLKSAMSFGGALASPSTAYLYDWNMLPFGQLLWEKELLSYKEFPPLQAPETYNLDGILQEMKKAPHGSQ
jgi:hypothetical protein